MTSSYFYPFAFDLCKPFCKLSNVEITSDNIEQNVSMYYIKRMFLISFKYYIELKGCIDKNDTSRFILDENLLNIFNKLKIIANKRNIKFFLDDNNYFYRKDIGTLLPLAIYNEKDYYFQHKKYVKIILNKIFIEDIQHIIIDYLYFEIDNIYDSIIHSFDFRK
jgi:hypothetical protein